MLCRNAELFITCFLLHVWVITISPIPFRLLCPNYKLSLYSLLRGLSPENQQQEILFHFFARWWWSSKVINFTGVVSFQWWGLGSIRLWGIFLRYCNCVLFYYRSSFLGWRLWHRTHEEKEAWRPLLCADFAYCGCFEKNAPHRPQYVLSCWSGAY